MRSLRLGFLALAAAALLASCDSGGSGNGAGNGDDTLVPSSDAATSTPDTIGGATDPNLCSGDEECPVNKPICETVCRTCGYFAEAGYQDGDDFCRSRDATRPVCKDGIACVATECDAVGSTDPKCPASKPECELPGQCVGCKGDEWCGARYADKPLCDVASGACVPTQCVPGTLCDTPGRHECTAAGRCEACTTDAFCAIASNNEKPMCRGGSCIPTACSTNADCGESSGTYCRDGACIEGCDPAAAVAGPGGCTSACGAGTPQVCQGETNTCLCLQGLFPGTGSAATDAGHLAASPSFTLQTGRFAPMPPPADGAVSSHGTFVLRSTLYLDRDAL